MEDVVAAALSPGVPDRPGLYVGCGNGRNYLPLRAAGTNLFGVDLSAVALTQLRAKAPSEAGRLVNGTVAAFRRSSLALVVGIQVFQHGDRDTAHAHMAAAQELLVPGGLFCIRVNATGDALEFRHEVEEESRSGFTATYQEGPKAGLAIRFFSRSGLEELFSPARFETVLPIRRQTTWREPRSRGTWSQWEAIWRVT